VNDKPVHKRAVGFVFQDYALFPHLTVAENVSFGLRYMKLGKRETGQRSEKALDIVNLQASVSLSQPVERRAAASGWPWPGPS